MKRSSEIVMFFCFNLLILAVGLGLVVLAAHMVTVPGRIFVSLFGFMWLYVFTKVHKDLMSNLKDLDK